MAMPRSKRTPQSLRRVDSLPAVVQVVGTPLGEDQPTSRHWGLVAGVGIGVAFVALAAWAHQVPYFPIDVAITRAVQGIDAPWFVSLLGFLSLIGFPPLVDVIIGVIALAIFVSGRRWEAISATFAAVGIAGLNFLVKALVARPRPPTDLVHVAHQIPNSTFPAGHVMTFTAFFGFLAYLLWAHRPPSAPRTTLAVILVVVTLLMGVARIQAGEHWPSDVLGGYLLGSFWLIMTVEFYRRARRHRQRSDRSVGSG
jgi:undecaprenyl-diphosphatase